MTSTSKLIETASQNGSTEKAQNGTETELIPAEYWLNLGIEVGNLYVPLPNGIALDQQSEKLSKINEKSPAKGETMQTVRNFQDVLIKAFMGLAKTIPAGESRKVDSFPNGAKLVVEIRHVGKSEKSVKATVTVDDLLTPKS